jgi:hypothetical protein
MSGTRTAAVFRAAPQSLACGPHLSVASSTNLPRMAACAVFACPVEVPWPRRDHKGGPRLNSPISFSVYYLRDHHRTSEREEGGGGSTSSQPVPLRVNFTMLVTGAEKLCTRAPRVCLGGDRCRAAQNCSSAPQELFTVATVLPWAAIPPWPKHYTANAPVRIPSLCSLGSPTCAPGGASCGCSGGRSAVWFVRRRAQAVGLGKTTADHWIRRVRIRLDRDTDLTVSTHDHRLVIRSWGSDLDYIKPWSLIYCRTALIR